MSQSEDSITGDDRLADPALRAVILGTEAATDGAQKDGAAERLAFWQEATAGKSAPDPALERALAREIMALYGQHPAALLAGWRGSLLVRAASTLRADTRAGNGPDGADILVSDRDQPFRGFFAIERFTLQHRRFAGDMGDPIRREVFVSTDAVTVLPYDPVRDRVLLVEQFRAGPLARGEARPWLIEAVAGRIDPGETPQEAARREAGEEAGISLGALLPVADYYPSPGALNEYMWSYVALADLPDGLAGLHGVASEGEDIRTHIIAFDEAMAWLAAGRLANAPSILSLFWLQRERDRLRRDARSLPEGGEGKGAL